jgi:outer membrane protein TolC
VELMEMERLSFEQLEDNYRRGRVSYLDLITGIRDLSEAREQYYASYFSLIKAAARHRATEGALYAWILSGN